MTFCIAYILSSTVSVSISSYSVQSCIIVMVARILSSIINPVVSSPLPLALLSTVTSEMWYNYLRICTPIITTISYIRT